MQNSSAASATTRGIKSNIMHRRARLPFHFITFHSPNRKTFRRDTELGNSKARAHVARVSHRKRKERYLPKNGFRSHSKGLGAEPELRDFYLSLGALTVMHHPVESGNTGNLDPFIRLAADLSRQDRNFVHFCKTILAKTGSLSPQTYTV